MHDFHLANEIVKIARGQAQKYRISKIKIIYLELGNIREHGQNIEPDNLRYNIGLLLSDAEVKIQKVDGDNWRVIGIEG